MSLQEKMSPQESLAIIQNMIQDARDRFSESGHIYVFWGGFIFILALAQYILLQTPYAWANYYPYFLTPLGSLYSARYYGKKKPASKSQNRISRLIQQLWIVISINILLLAFFFFWALQTALIPIILILSGIGVILSGTSLQERIIIFAGIGSNVLGFLAFWVELDTQPLVLAIAALISYFLPGLRLRQQYKRHHEV